MRRCGSARNTQRVSRTKSRLGTSGVRSQIRRSRRLVRRFDRPAHCRWSSIQFRRRVMMNSLRLTAHAAMRMSQRGLASDDLELIKWIGTEVEGGYLVREKDFQALDRELKQLRNDA